ncbi:MarR family winged helix-turn-helix transcriptional regulator [Pseudomonas sp. PGPR40]|uniref:MarR family winged helix-turn-helix transcriptional regulator n=1 Tax=Pseudomonas sp. PGPR40 TaxID=2913476 RepID=UPI001EDA21D3|nr:MarR family winged helix-turn-helix transcriptional regulator [Pseudomonas sp. PGPR40]
MTSEAAKQVTAFTLATFRLNGLLLAWGDRFSAGFGITSARWQMLGAIAIAGQPLTIPQIAVNMGVTRQGALKQLNLLTKEGLVTAMTNPMHKRSPLYVLTDQGQQTYSEIEKKWNEHAERLSTAIDPHALHTANELFAQVAELFAQELERQDEA